MTLFPFVQLEFTHSVGPDAGRYVVEPPPGEVEDPEKARAGATGLAAEIGGLTRAQASADVLIVAVVGGPPARSRIALRRRSRDAPADSDPREVPLQLVTFVRATKQLADKRTAEAALSALREDEARQGEEIARALAVLNVAVRAHRAAAGDPYVVEVTPEDARAVRLGYGTAEQVYGGTWHEAFVPAPAGLPRLTRADRLRPMEAVAAVLVGRARVLEGEDLALRALLEQRHGRLRAAALMAAAGLELLASELAQVAVGESDAERLAEVEDRAAVAAALAGTARRQPLDGDAAAEIERLALEGVRLAQDWRYDQL